MFVVVARFPSGRVYYARRGSKLEKWVRTLGSICIFGRAAASRAAEYGVVGSCVFAEDEAAFKRGEAVIEVREVVLTFTDAR
ncbi:hypothetical protein EBT31_11390 [bacterium]|nr:hypothetical protein [bacterium]